MKDMNNDVEKGPNEFSFKDRLSNRQVFSLSYSGLLFVLASLGCIAGLVWHLIRTREYLYKPYMATIEITENISTDILSVGMFDHYLTVFFSPIVLFLSAMFSALVGFLLLRAAGTANKEVIPRQDYELISKMLVNQNEKGVDHYIRLSSLTGITGIFTKVGLTGLPLATIFLTMFFTFLSIWGDQFFDLAKLTLGAFIGSYVQKQVAVGSEQKKQGNLG
jgi:hypothetical protein